jgi:protein-tyrosine phosphatase
MMRVLFVCLGNICRSPTAEAVFLAKLRQRGLSDSVQVDSAGTGDWHIGKAPDPRAIVAARARGYDLSGLRARQFAAADLQRFDLVLAMDHSNLDAIAQHVTGASAATTDLFLRRYGLTPEEVPDPYYGKEDGFNEVIDLIERGADALLAEVSGRL